jgi:16S rRNA (guanine527-N7)-methyltransferase
VIARAVAPLASLVELAAPLLSQNGLFIAMKAKCDEAELAAGRDVATIVGLEERSIRRLVLPDGGETRTIVSYVRTGVSRVTVPRRTGLAQHHPLA